MSSQSLEILVAEDDHAIRGLIERFLRTSGHLVHAFESGHAAWEFFQQHPVPLVVCDWLMPEGDGLEFCRRVRAASREEYTYFILLTSVSRSVENMRVAADAGVDDFLAKPVNPDKLWMRLRVASRILGYATQVKRLESLLPICSYCKKIRDDQNLWQAVEGYLAEHAGVGLSHSICPECYEKHVQAELDQLKRRLR